MSEPCWTCARLGDAPKVGSSLGIVGVVVGVLAVLYLTAGKRERSKFEGYRRRRRRRRR